MRALSIGALALTAAAIGPRPAQAQFEHERHAALFDRCEACHSGVATPDASNFPAPTFCAACHNGQLQPRVTWQPVERVSSLRFTHEAHPAIGCANCHNEPGADRMEVRRAALENCFTCHSSSGPSHRRATTSACTMCHGYREGAVRPEAHGPDWIARHGREASARAETCAACHIRQTCLDCHRPNPASWSRYHPPAFLTEHPVAAYGRQTSCADCHNVAQFCSSCHQQAGLAAVREGELQRGFHDANSAFLVGHGPAARQSLESCVSCHVERDCLSCHAALGQRRINPHGPGFDGDRLREKNAEMCSVCHGGAIPGGS